MKLKGPNYNVATCLKRDMSYTIQLYISSEYSYPLEIKKDNRTKHSLKDDENKNVRIKQDIFFGEVPLMTEEGTFVISGCERIIISQIIRSPGIYFRKEFNTSRKINYTATIISNKGPWTKIILDQKPTNKNELTKEYTDRIYIKLNDFRGTGLNSKKTKKTDIDTEKLFLFDLISHFGLNFQEISDTLKYPLHLSNQQYEASMNETDPVLNKKKLIQYKEDINTRIKTFLMNQNQDVFQLEKLADTKLIKN